MKQEDKKLLLRYLSMALPYGVIINTPNGDGYLNSINQTIFGNEYGINIEPTRRDYFNDEEDDFKPYLRSISSMTEEEERETNSLLEEIYNFSFKMEERLEEIVMQKTVPCAFIDWLNAHHFDYRGLIPKGLAIEVTESNNPYKD